ncbi:sodium/solute symporter [Sphingobacterium paramultivorum]|uniref:Sodium/solute symporter n=1 Tax=Sphingobacterium paramultivorum TaxID=2886510 RepID=A0A7G5E0Z3_9SPHI|nr:MULTISPECIES: sodium:solute symporter [Sphingobacterium]MCS4165043.1 SSS family solute:Na+ symporter [Sphingobacterium sp. BIGb0116]QMV67668.1 sodium/solute symporter [Sphingobacterium paramultivorum]WSO16549.1 sodium:solute symporter [Sphingobacterium paramultivorum]
MLGNLDLGIAIFYIVLILVVGILAGSGRFKKVKEISAEGYFLAGKTLRWPAIGLALFATNISTVHLVSLAQSGFDTGLLNGNFEWMAAFTLILLALFFVPFYLKSGVTTLPDFLERRYDRASRDWLTFISILSAIVIHIAFSMLAGGIVLRTLFGFNMYLSITVICVITGIYTILGGLRAVVVTESIQTIVLLAGAFIISFAAFDKMGGWMPMKAVLVEDNALDRLSMLRGSNDGSGMPWYAVLFGYPILGIWYWCADQTIVQRVLGAKDENHGRVGALFCGFLKILPVFIFVLPGLFAYTLFKTGQLDLSSLGVDHQGQVNSKGIYTLMITQLLPSGLIGVLVAALLSGLMSQISGALNSISTMVSYDIFKQRRPAASDGQLIRIGKIAAVIAMGFSLALLPLLDRYESIFYGINDVIAHIAPPITCVFLLGVFWKGASATAAKLTLWIGSVLGVAVFLLNKLLPDSWVGQTPFMMMAFYLFLICMLLQVLLSYKYPVQHTAQSRDLYWKSPMDPLRGKAWPGIGNYRILSALLLAIVVILYVIFN